MFVLLYGTGDPGKTRTSGPKFRKLVLYPAELRGHLAVMNTARPGIGKARQRAAEAVSRRILDDLCPSCAPLSDWRPILDRISRICWLFGSSIDTELRFPKP